MGLKWFFLVALLFMAIPAFAQVEEIQAHTGAVSCSACFNVALVSVKQIAGVADASGDMKEGWIRISVNARQGVSIKDVVERIRVAGFKDTAQFSITATGRLEQRGNRLVLVVPNQKEVFLVEAGERGRMASNAAGSKDSVRATGAIFGSGNQYDLKISKLQKQ